jgi:signal transduction histidine kinase
MRRRYPAVALFGGTLHNGPHPDQGYAVSARLPFHRPPKDRGGGEPLPHIAESAALGNMAASTRAPSLVARRQSVWHRLVQMGWPVDAVLVAALCLGALLQIRFEGGRAGPTAPAAAFSSAAQAWAVAWISLLFLGRRAPVVTGVAMAVMAFLQTYPLRFFTPQADIFALLIAVYTIGSRKPHRPHASVVAVLGAVGLFSIQPMTPSFVGSLLIFSLTLGAAAYVGTVVGERRRLNAELEQSLRTVAEERRTEVVLALRQERLTLAREMHDLVAHSLTLMVVQAGAARTVAAADPEAAHRAVQTVIDTGRQAAEELHQLLSLLRTGGDEEPSSPSSWDVDDLVNRARQSGLEIELERTGRHAPSAGSSLELSVYRIVQEGLTNVRKHAPGSLVRVHLRFDPRAVAVRIENDGSPGTAADLAALGAGRGLVGIRERVTMFGGRFEAGPGQGGGFVVDALMPLEVDS